MNNNKIEIPKEISKEKKVQALIDIKMMFIMGISIMMAVKSYQGIIDKNVAIIISFSIIVFGLYCCIGKGWKRKGYNSLMTLMTFLFRRNSKQFMFVREDEILRKEIIKRGE